jgi:hypothetical protein
MDKKSNKRKPSANTNSIRFNYNQFPNKSLLKSESDFLGVNKNIIKTINLIRPIRLL